MKTKISFLSSFPLAYNVAIVSLWRGGRCRVVNAIGTFVGRAAQSNASNLTILHENISNGVDTVMIEHFGVSQSRTFAFVRQLLAFDSFFRKFVNLCNILSNNIPCATLLGQSSLQYSRFGAVSLELGPGAAILLHVQTVLGLTRHIRWIATPRHMASILRQFLI